MNKPMTQADIDKAIEEIDEIVSKKLLAIEQEPVDIHCPSCLHPFAVVPVAEREWVGLTDDEILDLWIANHKDTGATDAFARAIEAKLKEKNT
jgi:hypothetical protein